MSSHGDHDQKRAVGETHRVSLVEIAGVLYRGRGVLAASTGVGLLLGATVFLLTPTQYEHRAVIEVGRVFVLPVSNGTASKPIPPAQPISAATGASARGVYQMVERPGAVGARLRSLGTLEYERLVMDSAVNPGFTLESSLATKTISENTLEVTIQATKESGAGQFMSTILEGLVAAHDSVVDESRRVVEYELARLLTQQQLTRAWQQGLERRLAESVNDEFLLTEWLNDASDLLEQLDQARRADLDDYAESLVEIEMRALRSLMKYLRFLDVRSAATRSDGLERDLFHAEYRAAALDRDIDELRDVSEGIYSTQVVAWPSAGGIRRASRYELFVVLGLLVGAFLGLLLAFVREFVVVNHQQIKAESR